MNHRYQLTLRPFSFCTVPKGFVTGSGKNLTRCAHYDFGSIAYPFQLSQDDVEHYDLKYLGPENTDENS